MEPDPKQVKRVNAAFERVSKAIHRYLVECANNRSPVKTLSVSHDKSAGNITFKIRYHKI
jgi:hypothetical protein